MSPLRGDMGNTWHHLFCILQPGPEDLMWPESQPWGISGGIRPSSKKKGACGGPQCAPTSSRRSLPKLCAPPLLPRPHPTSSPKGPLHPGNTSTAGGRGSQPTCTSDSPGKLSHLPCGWLSIAADELNQKCKGWDTAL